jgi:F420-0:gamma-glutamyl ligase
MTERLELFAVVGLPLVQAGDDLPALISAGLDRAAQSLRDRDVVVIAQKIVSKAEGRRRRPWRWPAKSARTPGSSRSSCPTR